MCTNVHLCGHNLTILPAFQTGALESHNCIQYGYLPSLSEQQLVDCSWSYGNTGCVGGLIDPSFQYVIDNGGIDTEAYYPYEGKVL